MPKIYLSKNNKYKIKKNKFKIYFCKKIIGRYCLEPYYIDENQILSDENIKIHLTN